MSDEQEMQFADPAWQPKVTREFEALPANGTPASEESTASTYQAEDTFNDDYARGYRAPNARPAERANSFQTPPAAEQTASAGPQQAPFQAQQAAPLSQQLQALYHRLPPWAWWVIGIVILSSLVQSAANQGGAAGAFFSLLVIGLLVLAGWLLATRRVRVSLLGETQAPETRAFTVGAQPTLILKNRAGSIRLHAGQEGQVAITTTRRGHVFSPSWDRETPIAYTQDQTNNTITARTGSWHLFGKNTIHFDITVPPNTHLDLRTDMGSIAVENVAGQISLRTQAGTINASNVTLQGKSRLKTDAGTIDFSGSLEPGGNYEIKTDLGTINATLSANSSFELSARTDLGTVATNLPLVSPQRNKLYGTVGIAPSARLNLKTDVGTINVQQQ